MFSLKVFILINNQLFSTANSRDINTYNSKDINTDNYCSGFRNESGGIFVLVKLWGLKNAIFANLGQLTRDIFRSINT